MSAFDTECPRCHGKGLPKSVAPVPQSPPYSPSVPPQFPVQQSGLKATPVIPIVGGVIALSVITFLGLKLIGSNIVVQVQPTAQNNTASLVPTPVSAVVPALIPTVAPIVVPTTPPQNPDTIITRQDAEYMANLDKVVLPETPSEDLSIDAQISVMRSNIRQAQAQLAQVPPTPRFVKAHSLLQDGFSKTSQGVTMLELGKNMGDKQTIDEGVADIHSGAEIMRQASAELKAVANKMRGR